MSFVQLILCVSAYSNMTDKYHSADFLKLFLVLQTANHTVSWIAHMDYEIKWIIYINMPHKYTGESTDAIDPYI